MTDLQGDDNIKGKQGNDVISTGSGFDLAIGGLGDDFVTNGSDEKGVFAGLGDDIVLGTDGRLVVQGNEGNDWLESGIHGDLLQGDNADQQQNDTLGGDDVILGGGNIDDVEGEGGDDIIVGRESGTTRFLGNLGYDWVSYYGESIGVNIDLSIFLEQTGEDPQRDRFDQLEAVSGGSGNDTILGTLVDGDILQPEDAIFHKLSQRALDLVDGFEALLRPGWRRLLDAVPAGHAVRPADAAADQPGHARWPRQRRDQRSRRFGLHRRRLGAADSARVPRRAVRQRRPDLGPDALGRDQPR